MFSWSNFQRKRCRQWHCVCTTLCLTPPPPQVFFLQFVKSTFVIFTSIFGRPAHQTPAYIIFFQSAKFRLLWLVDQPKCGLLDWSISSCWYEFKLQFQVSLCWTSIPCSSRHLVNFLPASIKDLDRRFHNDLHLYLLLQRVWFQQAMVLHASSIYMPWWVQILCWIWKIFSKWEIFNFAWNQVLGKSFSLNPK